MRPARKITIGAAAAVGVGAAWSLFESQWVEFDERDVPIDGLRDELEGFRILHVSDFHLGTISLNGRVLERVAAWASEREFDLVAVTGDLLSRRRGEKRLRRVLAGLRAAHGTFAVLGNHDVAETRDPFADARPVTDAELPATLLVDSSSSFEVRGSRVQVVGADPYVFMRGRSRLHELADPDATLRILLCHFPDVVRGLPPGLFDLVLAGHLHGGQICLPAPRGKLRFQHVRAPYWEGLYRTPAGTLHVSRGLGTAFVPFRLLARPEATALTLRASRG